MQCAVILEYWLGRIGKEEVMERLELPALRVWQLSQMALSGMLAGLLKQPRPRGGAPMATEPDEDPKRLKKRIRELEDQLKRTEELVRLLRDLPGNRSQPETKATRPRATSASRRGKKRSRPRATGEGSSASGSAEDRGAAPGDEETAEG
jgi:hypothetical protein